jgi:cytochrome c oxidase subunit 4
VSEHIVSPKIYAVIFGSLMLGTYITYKAAYVDLGKLNIVIALAIATFKAALVVLFFMHGRYSPKRTQLVIVCSVFWLAIMLALTLTDYNTRSHEMQPGVSRLEQPAPSRIFTA